MTVFFIEKEQEDNTYKKWKVFNSKKEAEAFLTSANDISNHSINSLMRSFSSEPLYNAICRYFSNYKSKYETNDNLPKEEDYKDQYLVKHQIPSYVKSIINSSPSEKFKDDFYEEWGDEFFVVRITKMEIE